MASSQATGQVTEPSETQAQQQELVERGLRIPGVAEAIAVYGSLQRYAVVPGTPRIVIRLSSGGNA